jgi:hypothetical protein
MRDGRRLHSRASFAVPKTKRPHRSMAQLPFVSPSTSSVLPVAATIASLSSGSSPGSDVRENGDEVRMRAKSPVLRRTESVWERVSWHSPASTQQNRRSSRLRNETPHLPVPLMRPHSVACGLSKPIKSVKGSTQNWTLDKRIRCKDYRRCEFESVFWVTGKCRWYAQLGSQVHGPILN